VRWLVRRLGRGVVRKFGLEFELSGVRWLVWGAGVMLSFPVLWEVGARRWRKYESGL